MCIEFRRIAQTKKVLHLPCLTLLVDEHLCTKIILLEDKLLCHVSHSTRYRICKKEVDIEIPIINPFLNNLLSLNSSLNETTFMKNFVAFLSSREIITCMYIQKLDTCRVYQKIFIMHLTLVYPTKMNETVLLAEMALCCDAIPLEDFSHKLPLRSRRFCEENWPTVSERSSTSRQTFVLANKTHCCSECYWNVTSFVDTYTETRDPRQYLQVDARMNFRSYRI